MYCRMEGESQGWIGLGRSIVHTCHVVTREPSSTPSHFPIPVNYHGSSSLLSLSPISFRFFPSFIIQSSAPMSTIIMSLFNSCCLRWNYCQWFFISSRFKIFLLHLFFSVARNFSRFYKRGTKRIVLVKLLHSFNILSLFFLRLIADFLINSLSIKHQTLVVSIFGNFFDSLKKYFLVILINGFNYWERQ